MKYNQFKRQQQYILQFAKVAPPGFKQQCLAEPTLRDEDDPYLKPIPQ